MTVTHAYRADRFEKSSCKAVTSRDEISRATWQSILRDLYVHVTRPCPPCAIVQQLCIASCTACRSYMYMYGYVCNMHAQRVAHAHATLTAPGQNIASSKKSPDLPISSIRSGYRAQCMRRILNLEEKWHCPLASMTTYTELIFITSKKLLVGDDSSPFAFA